MSYTISIIYGSVRSNRQGIKAAKFFQNQINAMGHTVHLIDPLEHELPMLDKMYKEYEGNAPEPMEKISNLLESSDGFIVVSGEYNHGLPPALKNLLDHYQKEYHFKPGAIVSYSAGAFGGVRSAVHLREVLGELGMSTIASMFPIPKVQDAFDQNGVAIDEAYNRRSKRFLDEFFWHVEALSNQRAKGTPY